MTLYVDARASQRVQRIRKIDISSRKKCVGIMKQNLGTNNTDKFWALTLVIKPDTSGYGELREK